MRRQDYQQDPSLFLERGRYRRWPALAREALDISGNDVGAAVIWFMARVLEEEPQLRRHYAPVLRAAIGLIVMQEFGRIGYLLDDADPRRWPGPASPGE